MNSYILNKKKCYYIIYDNNQKIILKNNSLKTSDKVIWSFLCSSFLNLSDINKILLKKYKFVINGNYSIKNEIIEGSQFYFIKMKDEMKNLELGSNLKIKDFSSLLTITLKESDLGVISKVFDYIAINKNEAINKFEKNFCKKYMLMKKNERVFYTSTFPSLFSQYVGKLLKEVAIIKNLPIMRICLHNNDIEDINEMLIVHSKPQIVGPLKQNNKISMSYLALDGDATIKQYNSNGTQKNKINISSKKNRNQYCRIDPKYFRTIESHSKYFIFLEICSGPFKDQDTIWGKSDFFRV